MKKGIEPRRWSQAAEGLENFEVVAADYKANH